MAKTFSAIAYCRQHVRDFEAVDLKVRACPMIASLKSVNEALTKLTHQPHSSVSEIAEVISRDLSLTARLLRLVNSVFGGLSVKITSIEEAIFFLGLRQIRQLAMTTRVIEEMEGFKHEAVEVDWIGVWRHSIASAILNREILTMTNGVMEDDTYYIIGLLHDIGKLVMLNAFPEELRASKAFTETDPDAFALLERKEFGFSHADLGAVYLERNGLSADIVEAVLFHHEPQQARGNSSYAAGVQVADFLARYAGCDSGFEPSCERAYGDWERLQGWDLLFAGAGSESQYAKASILRSIDGLSSVLQGLL
jgi:putative nucleotidyltransferase with HDIG domain